MGCVISVNLYNLYVMHGCVYVGVGLGWVENMGWAGQVRGTIYVDFGKMHCSDHTHWPSG